MTSFVSYPINVLQGEVRVPGDKSISHRALLLGAIAKGRTTIDGFLASDDCLATFCALQAMGVCIERPTPETVVVQGVGKYGLKQPRFPIDCGNSGTLIRLLAGVLAGQAFDSVLTGDASLQKRPMLRVSVPLERMGALITTQTGNPPLSIQGAAALQGIIYEMPIASAHVKSCLLLAALYAEGETVILEKAVTRDHTERMLQAFSYPVHAQNGRVALTGGGHCIATQIKIPGDLSSAAFFVVAATLIKDASLVIRSVGINPTRKGFISILKLMGANIEVINQRVYGEEPVADLLIHAAPLCGIDIPVEYVSLAIDEFPILFIAAACATGQTRLTQAKELRVKESDRLTVMAVGLRKLGIDVELFDDGLVIHGGQLKGGIVDCDLDHRIAMAFTIAGAVAQSAVTILGCETVSTSFPNFIQMAKQIGLDIREYNNERV